jgi:hypothetical protein
MTLSSASSKSFLAICVPPRRAQKIAASLQMLARSAPVRPLVCWATMPRSTSSSSGLSRQWTRRMCSRPPTSGGETKTWRSKRPGRSSAGSSFSSRLEAAITTSWPVDAKPSISTSSWLSVCSRSELLSDPRRAPTASSSSMNTIAGWCLRASSKRRRMRAAPRPANISTNEDADCEKNCAPDSWATALASSVLPVPGGPCRRMPFGTRAPRSRKRLGSRRNSTTSRSSSFASSTPAMSAQPISWPAWGLIWTGFVRGISFSVRHRT